VKLYEYLVSGEYLKLLGAFAQFDVKFLQHSPVTNAIYCLWHYLFLIQVDTVEQKVGPLPIQQIIRTISHHRKSAACSKYPVKK